MECGIFRSIETDIIICGACVWQRRVVKSNVCIYHLFRRSCESCTHFHARKLIKWRKLYNTNGRKKRFTLTFCFRSYMGIFDSDEIYLRYFSRLILSLHSSECKALVFSVWLNVVTHRWLVWLMMTTMINVKFHAHRIYLRNNVRIKIKIQ